MTPECAVITDGTKGSQMLSWLRRGRERNSWIESEAEMLVRDLGADAYRHARRKEREANSIGEAQEWKRVARAIASKTGKRGSWDSVSPQADDNSFLAYSEKYVALPRPPADQPEPVNRLRFLGPPPALLQPQLLSSAPHGGAALKKIGLRPPAAPAPAPREIEVLRPLAAAPVPASARPESDQSQPPPMRGKDAGGDTAAEAHMRSSLQQEREKIAILLQEAPEPALRRMLESASSQLNLVENCLSEAGMARRRTVDELAWWLRQTEELLRAAAIYTKCVSEAVAKSSARARSSQSG